MDYQQFVSDKLRLHHASGIDPGRVDEHALFPHQAAIVKWAARKGRAAIFADTGLGKTRMQLVWADAIHAETGHDCLILAPLAVAEQTRMEGEAIGIGVTHARSAEDIRRGIDLWTNPGDIVLSPFAGIGSEGFVAVELGRRFVGIELKQSYFTQAVANLRAAHKQADLFAEVL